MKLLILLLSFLIADQSQDTKSKVRQDTPSMSSHSPIWKVGSNPRIRFRIGDSLGLDELGTIISMIAQFDVDSLGRLVNYKVLAIYVCNEKKILVHLYSSHRPQTLLGRNLVNGVLPIIKLYRDTLQNNFRVNRLNPAFKINGTLSFTQDLVIDHGWIDNEYSWRRQIKK